MSVDLRDHPVDPHDLVYCPICGGGGRVPSDDVEPDDQELTNVYDAPCDRCEGEGVIAARDADCPFEFLTLYDRHRGPPSTPAANRRAGKRDWLSVRAADTHGAVPMTLAECRRLLPGDFVFHEGAIWRCADPSMVRRREGYRVRVEAASGTGGHAIEVAPVALRAFGKVRRASPANIALAHRLRTLVHRDRRHDG